MEGRGEARFQGSLGHAGVYGNPERWRWPAIPSALAGSQGFVLKHTLGKAVIHTTSERVCCGHVRVLGFSRLEVWQL